MEPKAIQVKISAYIQKHLELLKTPEDLPSELVKAGIITEAELEYLLKGSVFGSGFWAHQYNDMDLNIELKEKNTSTAKRENDKEKALELVKQKAPKGNVYRPTYSALQILGMDINTEDGKKIINRLALISEDIYLKANIGEVLIETMLKHNMEPTFENVANVIESMGISIRTEEEEEAAKEEIKSLNTRLFVQSLLVYMNTTAAELYDETHEGIYKSPTRFFDFGFYADNFNKLTKCDTKTLQKHFEKWANKYEEMNPYDEDGFKALFKEYMGVDLNEEAVLGNINILQNPQSKEFNKVYKEIFGYNAVKDANTNLTITNISNGFGDALIMITTLGYAGEIKAVKAGKMLAVETSTALGSRIAAKVATKSTKFGKMMTNFAARSVQLLGPSAVGGFELGGYELTKGTLGNIMTATSGSEFVHNEAMSIKHSVSSFGFGFFGGIWGQTAVAKVQKAVSRTSARVSSELAPKFAEKGSIEFSELMATYLKKSTPTFGAKAAGFVTEITGFALYETALATLENVQGFPDEMSLEDVTNILWEQLKGQGLGLGQVKLVSAFIMWSKGGKAAQAASMDYLSKSREFEGVKVREVKENGKTKYVIDGKWSSLECKSIDEVITSGLFLVQMDKTFDEFAEAMAESEDVKSTELETDVKETKTEEIKSTETKPEQKVKTEANTDEIKSEDSKLESENTPAENQVISDEIKQNEVKQESEQSGKNELPKEESATPTTVEGEKLKPEQKIFVNDALNDETAAAQIKKLLPEGEKSLSIKFLLEACKVGEELNPDLFNFATYLLQLDGVEYDDIEYIVGRMNNDKGIDYNAIQKFRDLINSGMRFKDVKNILYYSRDNNGFYNEDYHNRILSLNSESLSSAKALLNRCIIDGRIDEFRWQKALELRDKGVNCDVITDIIEVCNTGAHIGLFDKNVTGFNEDLYSKTISLIEEHHFNPKNAILIIEQCKKESSFADIYFDRAIKYKDKFNEGMLHKIIKFPDEGLNFAGKLKSKYDIPEAQLIQILENCSQKNSNEITMSDICMQKAEELLSEYKFGPKDVIVIMRNSLIEGKFNSTLYEEVIKLQQAELRDIDNIIYNCINPNDKTDINYDLMHKAIEWKGLGFDQGYWISSYIRDLMEQRYDINEGDIVKTYHEAGFKPEEIYNLLYHNNHIEGMTIPEFAQKIAELHVNGQSIDNILNTLIQLSGTGGLDPSTNEIPITKKNLDIVIDIVKMGIKNPARIIQNSYSLTTFKLIQEELDAAYRYVKEGVPEDRIQILQRQVLYNEPELEKVMIELTKLIRSDFDKNMYDDFVGHVYVDMYFENNKDIGNLVIDALKKGVKEETIFKILEQDWIYLEKRFAGKENANDIVKELKNKFIKAMVENPDKAEDISIISNNIDVMTEDQKLLDLCLKYIDNYTDIIETAHPMNIDKQRTVRTKQYAVDCIYNFEKAGLPLEYALKYTDILLTGSGTDKKISIDVINKVVELHNSNKIDNVILKMIDNFNNSEKFNDVIDEIARLRTEHLLDEFNDDNSYDLARMLTNKESHTVYDNFKDILDFYIKNKEMFGNRELADIIDQYTRYHETSANKEFDLSGFEAAKELIMKVKTDPSVILNMLYDTRVNRCQQIKDFVEKVNIEEFADEITLLLNDGNTKYYLIGCNLSQEALTVLLTTQKLLIEAAESKGEPNPDVLERGLFESFGTKEGEPEWTQEALNRLLYYIESDISCGEGIRAYELDKVIQLYKHHPQYISEIESLIGSEENYYGYDITRSLSLKPEVLKKQLLLADKLITANKKFKDTTLASNIYDILNTSEGNLEAKLRVWDNLQSTTNSPVNGMKNKKAFHDAWLLIADITADNEPLMYETLKHPIYRNQISDIIRYVTKENYELIDYIIKGEKIKDSNDIEILANRTRSVYDKFKVEFFKKNFDNLPLDGINTIADIVREDNADLILILYSDKIPNSFKKHRYEIANNTNSKNAELIKKLCTDKELDFQPADIDRIALATNVTKLYDLAEKLCTDKGLNCPHEYIADVLNAVSVIQKDIKAATLSEKINALAVISQIPKEVLDIIRKMPEINFDTKVSELRAALGKKRDVITMPAEKQKLLWQNILSNNNPESDNVLKTFDFAQYGKQGLPLEYSREQFTNNIENILKDLKPEEQQIILEHFGLIRGTAGFDGLPNNKAFDNAEVSSKARNAAQKIKEEIERFTIENRIKTGDDKADEVLNSLLQSLPEFTSIVGKEQHGTHDYSVDIHSLKVLQSAMNNPLYDELTDLDKTILKISALCHDFGKRGGVVDTGHASASAEYMAAILEKFDIPQRVKDRIIDIVENHHWFEAYNKGTIRAEDVAIRCRRPQDFIIYEILAKADLENVNETFQYGDKTGGAKNKQEVDAYFAKKMEDIDKALNLMYSKANFVFDTKFTQNGNKFPRKVVIIDGERSEIKVLNMNDIEADEMLTQYGFASGVTKRNSRFIVHMTDPEMEDLGAVWILTRNSLNQSSWSASLISPLNNPTYWDKQFGFIFDSDQANIAEAYKNNVGSGCKKTLKDFCNIIYNRNDEVRSFVKNNFIKELSHKGIKLSDEEYSQLAKELLNKRYSAQITQDITIGKKTIKAKDLIECLSKSADALFEGQGHNELVILNPRIIGLVAKVKKLSDCPEEFLKFAKEHDLPIILMKPSSK